MHIIAEIWVVLYQLMIRETKENLELSVYTHIRLLQNLLVILLNKSATNFHCAICNGHESKSKLHSRRN